MILVSTLNSRSSGFMGPKELQIGKSPDNPDFKSLSGTYKVNAFNIITQNPRYLNVVLLWFRSEGVFKNNYGSRMYFGKG